jgi:hypothetical protein
LGEWVSAVMSKRIARGVFQVLLASLGGSVANYVAHTEYMIEREAGGEQASKQAGKQAGPPK